MLRIPDGRDEPFILPIRERPNPTTQQTHRCELIYDIRRGREEGRKEKYSIGEIVQRRSLR